MVYLLLVFLLALIVLDFVKNKKLHTPGIIFNGIFFVTLFLYIFYLSDIQKTLTNRTVLIFFLCIISYNLPVFFVYYRMVGNKGNFYNNKFYSDYMKLKPKTEIFIYYIIMLLFVFELIYCKGCPLVWKFTDDTRVYVDFGMPQFHVVLWVLTTIMGSYTLFDRHNYMKYSYIILSILMITRGLLIAIIIGGVFYKLCSMKKLDLKTILILFVIGIISILSFSIIGNFRTGEYEFLKVAQFKTQYDWIPTSLKWIYSYVCFSVSNVNNLFSITNGFISGGTRVISRLFPGFIKSIFGLNVVKIPYFLIYKNFNVSTFMPYLYCDFGILGLILFCFGLGVYLSVLFKLSEKNCIIRVLYAISLTNVASILFDNLFLMSTYVFEVMLILFCYYLMNRNYYSKKIKGDIFYERNYFSRGKWN